MDLTGRGEADVPYRADIVLRVPKPAFLPTYPQLLPFPRGGVCSRKECSKGRKPNTEGVEIQRRWAAMWGVVCVGGDQSMEMRPEQLESMWALFLGCELLCLLQGASRRKVNLTFLGVGIFRLTMKTHLEIPRYVLEEIS